MKFCDFFILRADLRSSHFVRKVHKLVFSNLRVVQVTSLTNGTSNFLVIQIYGAPFLFIYHTVVHKIAFSYSSPLISTILPSCGSLFQIQQFPLTDKYQRLTYIRSFSQIYFFANSTAQFSSKLPVISSNHFWGKTVYLQ